MLNGINAYHNDILHMGGMIIDYLLPLLLLDFEGKKSSKNYICEK